MASTAALNEKDHTTLGLSESGPLAYARGSVDLQSRPECHLLFDPSQSITAEQFGIIRARLLNARSKTGIRSLLVTSPEKRDGKTFTSLNLAISLAQLENERILLIDGDLRLKGITRILELGQKTGLAGYLQRFAPAQECIHTTSLSHLYVVPAGNIVGTSLPAILEGPRMPSFLNTAGQEFDFIIVDSVPVLAPIADFELLLAACDRALLVVSLRKTARGAVDLTSQRVGNKLLGVVINNAEFDKRADYHASYVDTKDIR